MELIPGGDCKTEAEQADSAAGAGEPTLCCLPGSSLLCGYVACVLPTGGPWPGAYERHLSLLCVQIALNGNDGASQSRIAAALSGGALTIHDAAASHESKKNWKGQRGGGVDMFFCMCCESEQWCVVKERAESELQTPSSALCLLHPIPLHGELQSNRPSGTQVTKAAVYVHMCPCSQGSRAVHTGSGAMGWNQPLDVAWGLVTVMGERRKSLQKTALRASSLLLLQCSSEHFSGGAQVDGAEVLGGVREAGGHMG